MAFPAQPPDLRRLSFGRESFAFHGTLTLLGNASYPVSVRRLDGFATPLLSALPSRSAPCGSLRSLRPSSGRTFTSGPSPMLGTPMKGPQIPPADPFQSPQSDNCSPLSSNSFCHGSEGSPRSFHPPSPITSLSRHCIVVTEKLLDGVGGNSLDRRGVRVARSGVRNAHVSAAVSLLYQ
jgi:hypothetical protein